MNMMVYKVLFDVLIKLSAFTMGAALRLVFVALMVSSSEEEGGGGSMGQS